MCKETLNQSDNNVDELDSLKFRDNYGGGIYVLQFVIGNRIKIIKRQNLRGEHNYSPLNTSTLCKTSSSLSFTTTTYTPGLNALISSS